MDTVQDGTSDVPHRERKPRDPLGWPTFVIGPILVVGFLLTSFVAYLDWTEIEESKCQTGRDYLATATVLDSRAVPPKYVCRLEYSGEFGSPVYPTRTVTYDAAPYVVVAFAFASALALFTTLLWRALRPLRWDGA